MLALGKPSDNYVVSLSNWMDGMKPVVEEKCHFLDIEEDPVLLNTSDHGYESSKSFSKTQYSLVCREGQCLLILHVSMPYVLLTPLRNINAGHMPRASPK